jgi:hypothetical protein
MNFNKTRSFDENRCSHIGSCRTKSYSAEFSCRKGTRPREKIHGRRSRKRTLHAKIRYRRPESVHPQVVVGSHRKDRRLSAAEGCPILGVQGIHPKISYSRDPSDPREVDFWFGDKGTTNEAGRYLPGNRALQIRQATHTVRKETMKVVLSLWRPKGNSENRDVHRHSTDWQSVN